MSGITVLISPLSWGFGHAGRMIPLALELKRTGCRVIFAADAGLLKIAERELPGVEMIEIPGLRIRYSRVLPQYLCISMQLPRLVVSAIREHRVLSRLAKEFAPSLIISDNRFGFYHREIFSVYVTHQIRIPFPALIRFMEPLVARIHRTIINRYDLCLVPDYPGSENLSGRLSHGVRIPDNVIYTGPLSRFASSVGKAEAVTPPGPYICLILSGPEPQRSLFLEKVTTALRSLLLHDVSGSSDPASPEASAGVPHMISLVILSATPVSSTMQESLPSARFIITPDTAMMRRLIAASSLVITRAGYTSVMELVSLGKGAVLVPTPGQTEQEYLGGYLNGRRGFITLKQNRLELLSAIVVEQVDHPPADLQGRDGIASVSEACDHIVQAEEDTIAAALFEKAINMLLEQKKK